MSKSNAKAAAARLKQQQLNDSKQGADQQSEAESDSAAVDNGAQSAQEQTENPVPDSAASSDSTNQEAQSAEQTVQEPGSDTKTVEESKNQPTVAEEKQPPKKEGNGLVRVEFVGPYKRYSKGDIAAFSEETAKSLVKKGAALWPGEHNDPEKDPV